MDGSEAGGVFSFSIWMRDNSSNGDPSAENNFKSDIVQKILIDKDSYEILFENWQDRKYKGNKEGSHLQELWIAMTSNKAFIEPLKRLISLIQKNEIVAKEKKKSWFS